MKKFGDLQYLEINTPQKCLKCGNDNATIIFKKGDQEISLCNQCLFDLLVALENIESKKDNTITYKDYQLNLIIDYFDRLDRTIKIHISDLEFTMTQDESEELYKVINDKIFPLYCIQEFKPNEETEWAKELLLWWSYYSLFEISDPEYWKAKAQEYAKTEHIEIHRCCVCGLKQVNPIPVETDRRGQTYMCEDCYDSHLFMMKVADELGINKKRKDNEAQ